MRRNERGPLGPRETDKARIGEMAHEGREPAKAPDTAQKHSRDTELPGRRTQFQRGGRDRERCETGRAVEPAHSPLVRVHLRGRHIGRPFLEHCNAKAGLAQRIGFDQRRRGKPRGRTAAQGRRQPLHRIAHRNHRGTPRPAPPPRISLSDR